MIAHLESDVVTRHAQIPFTSSTILADIEFGTRNRDGDCVNIGICRIQPNVNSARPSHRRCPLVIGELSVGENGCLNIFFPHEGMLPCTARAFFSHWLFPLPVAYVLPENILHALAGLQQTILPAGTYPIKRVEGGYMIHF
ncbi:MAG: hypothetical protein IT259_07005 [Saprospiraceae bacterium]|nr:hypothetical protein [Saprospiraceae bacterium]